MAELYNLGIGLSVIDSASKPVQAVDAALVAMSKSTGLAGDAARSIGGDLDGFAATLRGATATASDFDMVLTGNSVDESLYAVGEAADDTQDEIEELTGAAKEAVTAWNQFGQSLGLVGSRMGEMQQHQLQMRDAAGRFTSVRLDGSLDSIAASAANVIDKTRTMFSELGGGSGFAMLGQRLSGLGAAVDSTVSSFESLQWLGSTMQETFLGFEDSTQKLAMGFGGTSEDAHELRSAMLDLGLDTQYSLGEISKLTGELAEAGVDLRDVAKEDQAAFISLNSTFGVSGQDIAAMSSTMRSFGGSMKQTLDEATAFQRDFGIPGVFAELPGIISGAQTAVIQFGEAVKTSLPDIERNVMRTAGIFAKAYGKTMRDAVQSAQQDFNRFAQGSRQHEDVFLGLADSFDPIQISLMKVGRTLEESSRLLQLGQKDSMAYAEEMRGVYLSLGEGSFQARLFRREMEQSGMSEAMMGLIFTENKLTEARAAATAAKEEAARADRVGIKSFDDLTKGMLSTVDETRKMWLNVKELGKAFLTQTGLTDVLREAFAGAKDTITGLAKTVKGFVDSEKMREWGKTLTPILSTVGKWFLILGTAAGGALGAVGSMVSAMGSLRGAKAGLKALGSAAERLPMIGKAFGPITKGIGGITKLFSRALPGIGTVVAAFSGITTAVSDMGEVLSSPHATGLQRFQAIFRGVLKGVGSAFNSLLLGIPGWVADQFFPDLEEKFNQGIADLFDFDYGRWGLEKLLGLKQLLVDNLPDWKEVASDWGKGIGGAIGGIAKTIVDFMVWGLKNQLSMIQGTIKWLFSGGMSGASAGIEDSTSVIGDALWSVLDSATRIAKEALVGLAEGFVGAFGTSLKTLGFEWQLIWSHMQEFAHVTFLEFESYVGSLLVTPIKTGLSHAQFAFESLWVGIKFGAKAAWAGLNDGLDDALSGIKIALLGIPKVALEMVSKIAGALNLLPTVDIDTSGLKEMEDEFKAQIQTEKDLMANRESGVAKVGHEAVLAIAALKKEDEIRIAGYESDDRRQERRIAAAKEQYAIEQAGITAEMLGHEQNQVEANQFRDQSVSAIDQALIGLAKGAKGEEFDKGQSAAAEKALRGHMDASLRTLVKRIGAGEIEMDEATKELEAAKSAALQKALKAGRETQRKAGDVGKAAKGKDGKTEAEKKEFASMMAQFSQSLAANRRQSIEVRFADRTGDAISRDMARRSSVAQASKGL